MIFRKELTKYDDSHKIVSFDAVKNGKYAQKIVKPEIASREKLAETYYIARKVELERLIGELKKGEISPVRLYMEYFHMNVEDLASRMNISRAKLQKHFTIEGFKKLKISDLLKYSVIFDSSVADFFLILNLDTRQQSESHLYLDGLLQDISVKTAKGKK